MSDAPAPRSILAFLAHPDDMEFLCAGTMLRLRDRGHRLHVAMMTSGDGGSQDLPPEEIAKIRREEARASSALLGASCHFAGQRDFLVRFTPEALEATVEIVRRCRPDIVITHYPSCYMLDHDGTSLLVRHATFVAPAPNFVTGEPPVDGVPHLYYTSPVEGIDIFGQPVEMDFYVDISSQIEAKAELLECHASQREWLRDHHGVDEYLDMMRRWSAEAGARKGVAFAEGFRQHLGHAYPTDNLLAELLES